MVTSSKATPTACQIILLLAMLVRTNLTLCVKALVSKTNKLTLENKQLKHKAIMKTSTITWRKIKTDTKMKFILG